MVVFDFELVVIGGGISVNMIFMIDLNVMIVDLQVNYNSINYLILVLVVLVKLWNDVGMIGVVYQLIKCG